MTSATTIASSTFSAITRSLPTAGSQLRFARDHSIRKVDEPRKQAEESNHDEKHKQDLKHAAPLGRVFDSIPTGGGLNVDLHQRVQAPFAMQITAQKERDAQLL